MSSQDQERLLAECRKVLAHSYSPYSRFAVGAALRATDGRIFTGVNVENSSYGLTMCAERVALGTAISQGVRAFDAIAIAAANGHKITPCGGCRQVLAEFAPTLPIFVIEGDGTVHRFELSELLPAAFSKADLTP